MHNWSAKFLTKVFDVNMKILVLVTTFYEGITSAGKFVMWQKGGATSYNGFSDATEFKNNDLLLLLRKNIV